LDPGVVVWVRCRFTDGLADANATHYLFAPLNPDWFYLPGFTFLVLAHPGSPGQSPGGCKTVVVVVVVVVAVAVA